MTDQIFSLLQAQPILSISLGFVLAVLIMILFKDLIKSYIKKKYQLYDETEVKSAVVKASEERSFYKNVSEKLTPTLESRVVMYLRRY